MTYYKLENKKTYLVIIIFYFRFWVVKNRLKTRDDLFRHLKVLLQTDVG